MGGYIGIGGKAKRIAKLYVGINGNAKIVKKAYVGVDGVARLWLTSRIFIKDIHNKMTINEMQKHRIKDFE